MRGALHLIVHIIVITGLQRLEVRIQCTEGTHLELRGQIHLALGIGSVDVVYAFIVLNNK